MSTSSIPDLESKPEDIVGYCFGYACSGFLHVNFPFETISVEGFKDRKVCQKCGEISRPCTVRRIAEAFWDYLPHRSIGSEHQYEWKQMDFHYRVQWSKFEFIKFLED